MSSPVTVGIAWCVFHRRPGWASRFLVRPLPDAYRGPGLFATEMRGGGHACDLLALDEELGLADLDGKARPAAHEDVDVLYVATHGQFDPSGYRVYLHKDDWWPGSSGIGNGRLVVAVFDTCELIDGRRSWASTWASATNLGPSLRLLLGFDGLATMDRGSGVRGRAFAELLIAGDTFANAWIKSVHQTTPTPHNRAVAIGIGDDAADADWALDHAALRPMPPARSGGGPPVFRARY